jgi:hypothetical protein
MAGASLRQQAPHATEATTAQQPPIPMGPAEGAEPTPVPAANPTQIRRRRAQKQPLSDADAGAWHPARAAVARGQWRWRRCHQRKSPSMPRSSNKSSISSSFMTSSAARTQMPASDADAGEKWDLPTPSPSYSRRLPRDFSTHAFASQKPS